MYRILLCNHIICYFTLWLFLNFSSLLRSSDSSVEYITFDGQEKHTHGQESPSTVAHLYQPSSSKAEANQQKTSYIYRLFFSSQLAKCSIWQAGSISGSLPRERRLWFKHAVLSYSNGKEWMPGTVTAGNCCCPRMGEAGLENHLGFQAISKKKFIFSPSKLVTRKKILPTSPSPCLTVPVKDKIFQWIKGGERPIPPSYGAVIYISIIISSLLWEIDYTSREMLPVHKNFSFLIAIDLLPYV